MLLVLAAEDKPIALLSAKRLVFDGGNFVLNPVDTHFLPGVNFLDLLPQGVAIHGPYVEITRVLFQQIDDILLIGGTVHAGITNTNAFGSKMRKNTLKRLMLFVFSLAVAVAAFHVNRHIINTSDTRLVATLLMIGVGRIVFVRLHNGIVIIQYTCLLIDKVKIFSKPQQKTIHLWMKCKLMAHVLLACISLAIGADSL